jgi:UDP-3-O-[3-hydroxymyristoyl] glucosamine N-acyltransferase
MYSSGIPAVEARKWRRILGRIKQLDELAKSIKALESTNK